MGPAGIRLHQAAVGEDVAPLVPVDDARVFADRVELEWPIEGLEPLSFVLARQCERLSVELERADRGAVALHTTLTLVTRASHARVLALPAPMRDAKVLRTLILLDLESHPPDAPIDSVRVCLEPAPARVLQWTLLERAQPAPEQVSTLIARLTALMGEGHVGSPVLVDTWKPGAFAMAEFRSQISDCRSQHSPLTTQHSELRSALRRFRLPIPARVTVREGRPVRVQMDRQGYTSGAVTQAAGPWRTSGHWWAADGRRFDADASVASSAPSVAWDRDEWDVAMADGTVYRLVVERGVGQWCVEGLID
jgi:protein ImuB